jgi:hypothetical protein
MNVSIAPITGADIPITPAKKRKKKEKVDYFFVPCVFEAGNESVFPMIASPLPYPPHHHPSLPTLSLSSPSV